MSKEKGARTLEELIEELTRGIEEGDLKDYFIVALKNVALHTVVRAKLGKIEEWLEEGGEKR